MHVYVIPVLCFPDCSFCLLEAINRNGLLFFLLSNLLTGAVNFAMPTFLAPPTYAYVILVLYMLTVCQISGLLHMKNVTVKFW